MQSMTIQKRQIFYSFHFNKDVMRVQQIRNMGVIEGNEPVSPNTWETARKTPGGIEKWINENMRYKSCIVVLVGSETSTRPWVKYEIEKAWNDGKPLVGVFIHNLKCPRTSNLPPYYGKCAKGANPFAQFTLKNGNPLTRYVQCHDPNPVDAYNDIYDNLADWIEAAIAARQNS